MSDFCVECGAAIPAGGSCQHNFHELLLLESRIPGGPGLAHFYAVASYNLQHPDSMNLALSSLQGIQECLAEMLDGRTTIENVRRRVRRDARAGGRVTRRPTDPQFEWRRGSWPITIAEALRAEEDVTDYTKRVLRWAEAVRNTLAGVASVTQPESK